MMERNFVGEKLKYLRKKLGLTQSEMILKGKIISVSQYSKIENGIHNIDLDTFFKIINAHPKIDRQTLLEELQYNYGNWDENYSEKNYLLN